MTPVNERIQEIAKRLSAELSVLGREADNNNSAVIRLIDDLINARIEQAFDCFGKLLADKIVKRLSDEKRPVP